MKKVGGYPAPFFCLKFSDSRHHPSRSANPATKKAKHLPAFLDQFNLHLQLSARDIGSLSARHPTLQRRADLPSSRDIRPYFKPASRRSIRELLQSSAFIVRRNRISWGIPARRVPVNAFIG